MPTIKVQVDGKIAKNLTPEEKIVCGNEDYQVEFEFDEKWSSVKFKTGLFVFNGNLVPVIFEENVCPMPIIENTTLLAIGVMSNDGLLKTTTPAYADCLKSASDLAKNNIPAPSKDVYGEIIALLNKYLAQGSSGGEKEIVKVPIELNEPIEVTNLTVEEFKNLSERYARGEIVIVGELTSEEFTFLQDVYIRSDKGEYTWRIVSQIPHGGKLSTGVYEITWSDSKQKIYLTVGVYNLGNLPDPNEEVNIGKVIGMELVDGVAQYVAVDLPKVKEALTSPSETWTPDEQAAACKTIGALKEDTTETTYDQLYVKNADGTFRMIDIQPVGGQWVGGGIPRYSSGGCFAVNDPTWDTAAANKRYVDGKVGDIEKALDSIIAIQESLIGGGTV